MRAWAVVENGKPLKEIELPTPEPTGTEVLLEVTHCGVCHSDLHIWEGYYDVGGGQKMSLVDRGVTLPLAMGHEIVGRVVKCGPAATGVKAGDIRIVYPWLGCGTCATCLGEDDNMCTVAARSLGVYQNGGYGTHVIAPHPRHLVDPGTLDLALAATYACSGITVYSGIKKAMATPGYTPDEAIVLVGAGGLGLNAIQVLKALKHRNIVSVDISEEKRNAALAAGATKVVDGSGDGVWGLYGSQQSGNHCGNVHCKDNRCVGGSYECGGHQQSAYRVRRGNDGVLSRNECAIGGTAELYHDGE